ncbi:MAG: hypothetical protein PHC61_08190 [Chitinivibrionales bacterium]|nr:hypothetical protein [Chitinivibrionales bacterium]
MLFFRTVPLFPALFLLSINAAADPSLGAHNLAYYGMSANNNAAISTQAMTTQGSGSTILACIGRGIFSDFAARGAPGDNKGNVPYIQLGTAHIYTLWPYSGTALYAYQSAAGGGNHIVTADVSPADEITLAVVEVKNGGLIADYKWNEVLSGNPITSLSVTTTGPATLVAFWWGDGYASVKQTAVPNNGFTVIDTILLPGNLVQAAVAVKSVSAAGSYNVTWTSTPVQGAQLWLAAVQTTIATTTAIPPVSGIKPFGFTATANTISYSLQKSCFVSIKYYDLRGRLVSSFVNNYQQPGNYTLKLPTSLPRNVYIRKFKAGDFVSKERLPVRK